MSICVVLSKELTVPIKIMHLSALQTLSQKFDRSKNNSIISMETMFQHNVEYFVTCKFLSSQPMHLKRQISQML